MTSASFITANVLVFGLMVLVAIGRESTRTLIELRRYSGFVDRPSPVDVDVSQPIADLPAMSASRLATGAYRDVLIVHDRCLTCFDVLRRVNELETDDLIVLVNARSEDDAIAWLASNGMKLDERVLFDAYGLSAMQLGVSTSPVVVQTEDGLPVHAWTVPSARQLSNVLNRTAAPMSIGAVSESGGS